MEAVKARWKHRLAPAASLSNMKCRMGVECGKMRNGATEATLAYGFLGDSAEIRRGSGLAVNWRTSIQRGERRER